MECPYHYDNPPPPHRRAQMCDVKNASSIGTIDMQICFASIWIFRRYRDFPMDCTVVRIDVMTETRETGEPAWQKLL
jgi:hypothetical protein